MSAYVSALSIGTALGVVVVIDGMYERMWLWVWVGVVKKDLLDFKRAIQCDEKPSLQEIQNDDANTSFSLEITDGR